MRRTGSGQRHEEQDAQPDQGPVHADDEVKGLMVREPEDAEDDEADYERPEAWDERPEAGGEVYARRLGSPKVQYKKRHGDREDAIRQRQEAARVHPDPAGPRP